MAQHPPLLFVYELILLTLSQLLCGLTGVLLEETEWWRTRGRGGLTIGCTLTCLLTVPNTFTCPFSSRCKKSSVWNFTWSAALTFTLTINIPVRTEVDDSVVYHTCENTTLFPLLLLHRLHVLAETSPDFRATCPIASMVIWRNFLNDKSAVILRFILAQQVLLGLVTHIRKHLNSCMPTMWQDTTNFKIFGL